MRKKIAILLPIVVWILLCVLEWYWWINPPYAFFFARGSHNNRVNVNYTAVTQGDLVAENIFVTPVPRRCLYVTDQYGSRNLTFPPEVDTVLVGDSFTNGGGSSYEDSPAVQLERLTGKKVCIYPRTFKDFEDYDLTEKAAFLLKGELPVDFKTLIYLVLDADLLEPPVSRDLGDYISMIGQEEIALRNYSPMETFGRLKNCIKNWSPQAIIARKIKSYLKVQLALALHKAGVFERADSRLEYLDKSSKVYAFRPFQRSVASFSTEDEKFKQEVEAFEQLNLLAQERGKNFMVVVIPRKEMAYRKYFHPSDMFKGYGPGEVLANTLERKGINTLLVHPVLFKAVQEEMEEGKNFVYWSDDTHWGPYGINLAMQEVKRKLVEIGAL